MDRLFQYTGGKDVYNVWFLQVLLVFNVVKGQNLLYGRCFELK